MNCLNISEYAVCIAAIVAIVAGIAAIPETHYEKGSIYVLHQIGGNDSNLLIVFYVQIMPDDFVMQLHRF